MKKSNPWFSNKGKSYGLAYPITWQGAVVSAVTAIVFLSAGGISYAISKDKNIGTVSYLAIVIADVLFFLTVTHFKGPASKNT
jgi:hypothetical protein